ncbi:LOW QUALITY PROTEIN: olfactory receptor 2M4-like [Glossophaga mutica]
MIKNQTSNFILLGIFDQSPTNIFLFSLVLSISGLHRNTIMILLIYTDTQLHTLMYFLLSQLSFMDLMLICTTVPKMAFNYLSGSKSISLISCEAQIFFWSLVGAECFLMAVMAYDCYVAICHPVYTILMNQKLCVFLAIVSWILSCLDGFIVFAVALSFSYCRSVAAHYFFCDIDALLPSSCTDTFAFERLLFICYVVMLIFPVSINIISYSRVLQAIIHMSSVESCSKAFTTCSSHLSIVGLYYGVSMFMYMRLASNCTPDQEKMVSAFYTILTPMLDPLIYSLHNKELSRGLQILLRKEKLM